MGDISSTTTADVDMAASVLEHDNDATPSSLESTPEQEVPQTEENQGEQPVQPQKRKGGRKPIYATSEERKQRNRQAQAAFRERRTEYIKQLEAQIKQNEDTLATLQQSHRSAADECLMLRYKNSLLERILLEKGIDVQSELSMKNASPTFGPGFMHPGANIPQVQAPLQRTAIQRQHARRSGQKYVMKESSFTATSPHGQPTPPSHTSSPTNISLRSPVAVQQQQQGGITPPASSILAQPHTQHFSFPNVQQQQQQPQAQQQSPHNTQSAYARQQNPAAHLQRHNSMGSANFGPPVPVSAGAQSASAYYPTPFQKHIDQLGQEYDAHEQHHHNHNHNHSSAMLDPADSDPAIDPSEHDHHPFAGMSGGSGEYYQQPNLSAQQQQQQQMTPSTQYSSLSHSQPPAPTSTTSAIAQQQLSGDSDLRSMAHMIDPNDPMLDADPFGLSASMHYPTAYSFDRAPQR